MKKFLPIAIVVVLFAACKSEPKEDLTTNKDFMLMENQQVYPNNALSDTGVAMINDIPEAAPLPERAPKEKVRTIVKYIPQPKAQTPVYQQPQTTTPPVVTAPATPQSTTPSTGVGTDETSTASTGTTTAPEPVVKKKEGWSDAAKGATIGGVGGAVAGAVIGKNVKGAAIGAVLGAAGGYVLGRKKDKNSGRVE